jgi:hypothetical protein
MQNRRNSPLKSLKNGAFCQSVNDNPKLQGQPFTDCQENDDFMSKMSESRIFKMKIVSI